MASQQVLNTIPHREPFLFIDEILEQSETKIRCSREIRKEEEQFKGHYPHFPIMPGVLLCEAIFQAGALLIASGMKEAVQGVPVVTRANNIRFSKMVVPGDQLEIIAEVVEVLAGVWFMKGRVNKAGKACCRLEFACTLLPEGEQA
jgi:3-hydroxyacyl-[acyl-carrier-protein] dehydratase